MKRVRMRYLLLSILLLISMVTGCSKLEGMAASGNPTVSTQEGFKIEEGKLNVIFLDVGQGDSELIISPDGKAMLIDAGERGNSQTILDTIKACGVEKLDIVVGTHPHSDHIGSMAEVLKAIPVDQLIMPKASSNSKTFEKLLETIQAQGLKVTTAKAGLREQLGDSVTLDFLAPIQEEYDDTNNYSAVIKLTYKERAFLFTGDAESLVEKEILEAGSDVSADVLKCGHHGSKTSTSKKYLDAVNPQIAVMEVGEGNQYGHPHEEILERLKKKEITVYRTDLNGTIVISSDGSSLEIAVSKAGGEKLDGDNS